MKSARKMFEELGWQYFYNDFIKSDCYSKNKKNDGYVPYYNDIIKFYLESKCVYIDTNYKGIDMETLKAINKQCEELGWLDDNDD